MGKAIGTIAGSLALDSGIKRGAQEGQVGYSQAIDSYTAGKQEGLGYLQPYRQGGAAATDDLTALLTGRRYDPETGEYTDLSPEERFASFEASPGYQFRMDQGLQGVQATLAAQGKSVLGGRGLTELQNYGQGTASSEYGNFINNLFGLSGIGQNAAGQSANIATGTANQIAGAQVGYHNLGMQSIVGRAQNRADTYGSLGVQFDQALGIGAPTPPTNATS